MLLVNGTRLGPYEIVAPLGAGGMGEVYKARDTRLNRIVALKRLTAQHTERFEQEARAIASLNHPHICQIYDVGPDYLVLEYVEGQTLADVLATDPRLRAAGDSGREAFPKPEAWSPKGGALPLDRALRLAVQIASALEMAHRRGILHRDLKPANIMVTPGGAKLLDFGLAKLMTSDADMTRTMEGTVLGTAAYMAPEQAEGKEVDARSEVFSLGAVLYEMLSGSRAFGGNTTVQVLNSVMRAEPPRLSAPPVLERIVSRCLAKQPAHRFQTMVEVRAALEQAARESGTRLPEPQASIAVLPFANLSADKENEYFGDGLAEEIINALTHIPGLKVIARTSAFAFKDKHQDIRSIAEALGVANILEGSVRRAGNRLRVTAQLITAADGSHLWSERYDREMTDVFAIQDEIAQAIAGTLEVKLVPKPAGVRRTPKLPAYEALLKGRYDMLRHTVDSLSRAKDCFEQAMALDPDYAEPHANLGLNYLLLGSNGMRSLRETMPLVRAEAREALSLDPSEPGPHFLLGAVAAAYEYDWKKAAEHFATAIAGQSVSAETHWAYASFYLQPLGHFHEAVAQMEQAVERDPLNVFWRGVLISHLTHAKLYDRAIAEAHKALETDENHLVPYLTLSEVYVTTGRWREAIGAAERARRIAPEHSLGVGMLAAALVQVGEKRRAEELVREMDEAPLPGFGRVLYHLLCSETDAAADWWERCIEQRDMFAIIFANPPVSSAFRQSARWPKLARMMNLPDAT